MTGQKSEAPGMDAAYPAADEPGQDHKGQLERVPESAAPAREQRGDAVAVSETIVEHHRHLASRVLFGCGEKRVIMAVTAAVSGEGVTTSSAAAALALANSTTKRVLLLDANLRRPAAHDLFGVPASPGLYQAIQGIEGSSPFSPRVCVVHPTAVTNLWLAPAGISSADPTRLLTSDAAREAFEMITKQFDYVVVDCPPVLTSIDAVALCRLATRTVIVVRAELTPREDVKKACAQLSDARLMGVLLNEVDE